MHFTPNYRVELVVKNRAHFYDVLLPNETEPSHRFGGVTGVLSVINKPALVPWAKREALLMVENALLKKLNGSEKKRITVDLPWIAKLLVEASQRPEKIKDDAADLGTRVHAAIDLIVVGKDPGIIAPDLEPAVCAFQEWWENSGIEIVAGDTKVASLIHKYGGSLDALGRRNGHYVLLDWKTSNGTYKEMALQVAAYVQALFETYGIQCEEAIVVRFSKKLPIEFQSKEVRDIAKSLRAFLSAQNLKESLDLEHFKEK